MAMKAGVSGSVRRMIFRRDKYTCQTCGLTGWEERFPKGGFGFYTTINGVYLSIDHRFPKSLGGSHSPENLRTLCTRCNTVKGVKVEVC